MALTEEQVKALKEQLSSQIENLPFDKKEEAQRQIDSLSTEALEMMLKQQNSKSSRQKSVFRMIIDNEIPSYKLDENSKAIAVLEINPISKGHTIIIPKTAAKTAKELPTQAFSLAKKLSKSIISKLKAKSAEIQTETKFNEAIINVIPIYDAPLSIDSPRNKAEKSDLESIESKLKVVKRIPKPKVEKIKIKTEEQSSQKQASQVLKLKRKIP